MNVKFVRRKCFVYFGTSYLFRSLCTLPICSNVLKRTLLFFNKRLFYSELIGSKHDNIQVLPSEIQEFPSTS